MKITHAIHRNQRRNQEDAFCVKESPGVTVLAVADGMGGHANGALASKSAIDTVLSFPASISGKAVLEAAHKRVSHSDGRGSTLTLAKIRGHMLTWAHVGDSRLWLIRDGKAHQLTMDHSFGGAQLAAGRISLYQFDKGAYPQGILSFLGAPKDHFEIEVGSQMLYPGDFVVLTSDGLHVETFRRDLPQLVRQGVDFMITYAMAHGSTDNATVILAEV